MAKTVFHSLKVTRNFDPGVCIKTLGLEEKGRLQQICANEILKLSDPYIPLADGGLSLSGHIENDADVVWNKPYAHYMWEGIVYEDPDLHCAGFKTDNGWRSRKDVDKVPTKRSLEYGNGTLRGAHWADRMLQNGGLEKIEKKLQEELLK